MLSDDGEIVDVNLATLLFELFQLVGSDAPDNMAAFQGGQCNKRVAAKQSPQIGLAWRIGSISVHVIKGFAEGPQQGIHQRHIIRGEMTDIYEHRLPQNWIALRFCGRTVARSTATAWSSRCRVSRAAGVPLAPICGADRRTANHMLSEMKVPNRLTTGTSPMAPLLSQPNPKAANSNP